MGERKLEQFSWNWSFVTNNKYFCLLFSMAFILFLCISQIKCFFVANVSRRFICSFFFKFLRNNFSQSVDICAIPVAYYAGNILAVTDKQQDKYCFSNFSNERNRSNLFSWNDHQHQPILSDSYYEFQQASVVRYNNMETVNVKWKK